MLGILLCLVTLSAEFACSESSETIRLRGGSAEWEGRVEVYNDGRWGTVCDDQWTLQEATVACRELGYPLATVADRVLRFGKGDGPIWMDDVDCVGNEERLEDCDRNDYGDNDCSHSEDAGVICSTFNEGAVRLLGSSDRFEGRVEVMIDGSWGTVCDHGWSDNDADVVCRQLGYKKAKTAVTNAYRYFGYATSPYVLEDMRCDGYEESLLKCLPLDRTPGGCDVYDVAGVFCHGSDNEGMSPEAIAGIVLGCLFFIGIFMCCVIGVISAKSKKKRATTSRQEVQADQMVYHVSNTGATSISGFPQQGPYSQYAQPGPPAYGFNVNPAAVSDAPPAYNVTYEAAGPGTVGATAAYTQPGAIGQSGTNTDEHIYKEAL